MGVFPHHHQIMCHNVPIDYRRWVSDHLLKSANLSLRPKVVALFEYANKLLDIVKMELSSQKGNFVRQSLATRAILSPKLIIKYHKTINKKWKFPTKLVLPATNFTVTFSKIGYLGIKRFLDKGKVNYSRVYIFQTSELKERLEEMKINRDKVKIASVDVINMYPSIKISTIRKAVKFFARKITAATKKTINLCLELTRFGMSSTLTSFDGEYYKYHGRER